MRPVSGLGERAHDEKRNAIRETWGRLFKESYSSEVVVRFFVHCSTGEPCQETEAHLGDIIYTRDRDDELGPLAEGQEGVTQRVYLMFQHVVSSFDVRFVLKADDDTFINAPAIVQMLYKLSKDTSNYFYVGMRMTRQRPLEEEEELAALAREDEAVEGIVALNHATGLRFLHYEDVAVGVWVSGMRLKFITDRDIGYRFVGHANQWDPEQRKVLKVTDNFCQDADMPTAWIHPLKEKEAFLEVARVSGACKWTASLERSSGPKSV
ncbi:g4246 [Coccomyxa viridis]|uniref:Hexosyltransferase n=1 Tax=Coccomyxa viridis TaxID=1274662 RepID=A0ABP1FPV4_9CHLO